jgi:hypothetical protein
MRIEIEKKKGTIMDFTCKKREKEEKKKQLQTTIRPLDIVTCHTMWKREHVDTLKKMIKCQV